jgi:hypothetical protein
MNRFIRHDWSSPLKDVDPSFIELNGRGGLGWSAGISGHSIECRRLG